MDKPAKYNVYVNDGEFNRFVRWYDCLVGATSSHSQQYGTHLRVFELPEEAQVAWLARFRGCDALHKAALQENMTPGVTDAEITLLISFVREVKRDATPMEIVNRVLACRNGAPNPARILELCKPPRVRAVPKHTAKKKPTHRSKRQ